MPKNLWPRDVASAARIQEELRKRVKITRPERIPKFVAGLDAAFHGDSVIAVASLYSYPELHHLEDAVCREEIGFPYVPGYLSFREGHAIISAVRRLHPRPDLLLMDGQGIAHPRGIGIASHIGVLLDIPTVGCAKSRLIGEFSEPGRMKGAWKPLLFQGKTVGSVLRTRTGVRPVFVSPGHLTDIRSSREIVLHCTTRFRIPEPIRRADHISKIPPAVFV